MEVVEQEAEPRELERVAQAERDVVGADLQPRVRLDLVDVRGEVLVREHGRARCTGRPRGEEQHRDLAVVALQAEQARDFGTLKATPYPVVHGESGGPFFAYRIESEGRTIAYSADTEWTETLVPAARDADLFICEAYYYDRIVKNHLSLATLEEHLPRIAPKKLVLTHMSDDMLGRLDTLAYTAASDGMVVEF